MFTFIPKRLRWLLDFWKIFEPQDCTMFISDNDINANHTKNSTNYAIKSHNWIPMFWRDMQTLSSWMKNYIQVMLK